MLMKGCYKIKQPYIDRNNAVVGWILVYKHSKIIRTYINRDVMFKILGYLKIIEIPWITNDGFKRVHANITFTWCFRDGSIYKACTTCLMPCIDEPNYYHTFGYACGKCHSNIDICESCLKKFEKTHILL